MVSVFRGWLLLSKWTYGGFKSVLTFIFNFKRFIPVSMLGIFLVTDFFTVLIKEGLNNPNSYMLALQSLSEKVLAAELTIRKYTLLAVENSAEYTLYGFYSIIISLYIIYVLYKFIRNRLTTSFAANKNDAAPLWAAVIVILIELFAIKISTGEYFIPILNGIIYAGMNIAPIIMNIHIF